MRDAPVDLRVHASDAKKKKGGYGRPSRHAVSASLDVIWVIAC